MLQPRVGGLALCFPSAVALDPSFYYYVGQHLIAAVDYDLKSSPLSSRWKYRPTLAWLLLAVVGYSALVEIVHSHARVQRSDSNVAAFSGAGDGSASTQNYSDQQECPTCQFQRQLFGGYVNSTPFTASPVAEFVFESSPRVLYISTLATSRPGRGPPTA
ncbi:MAG TPA: hypothetical protein VIR01_05810 [Pyrinomonadaceae bacterium]